MRWRLTWAAALLLAVLPEAVAGSGAWTTMLRAESYSDLIADGDTVWCATLEGGLLRFSRASGTFEGRSREPGGLVSNRLTALAMDRSRRLWIGTLGAGAAFLSGDRAHWGLVSAFDGLQSDSVTVLESHGDTIWIGTTRGIAFWNGREIAGVLPGPISPPPFAHNGMTGIAEFAGDLWVATQNGIYRSPLAGDLTTWTPVNAGLSTTKIDALASDGASLLALDGLRVHRLDPPNSQWVLTADIGNVYRLSDDLGTVCAASQLGIYRWNGAAWDLLNGSLRSGATTELTFSVAVDGAGRFVAANRTGLYLQPAGAGAWPLFFPPGPPGNNIQNLDIQDSRLYVTTHDDGVGRYDGSSWKYWFPSGVAVTSDTTFRRSLFAYALLVDRKGLKWVGCWESGLERFDDSRDTTRFTHYWASTPGFPCAPSDTILHTMAWASAADSSGGRWFGLNEFGRCEGPALGLDYYDSSGVFRANYRAENSPLRGDKIHALTVTHTGRVFLGYTGQGIGYFDLPATPGGSLNNLVRHVSGTDNMIVEGLAARGEAVWALTTGSIDRYSLAGGFEDSYPVPASPSASAVRPVDVAPDGSAWVGTLNGIRICHLDGSYEDLTTANSPLADDDVRAIRIDPVSRAVWIGTGSGLNRYQIGYVAPVPPPLPRLELRVFPNPARVTALGISLRLSGNASGYRGRILDLSGRLMARFTTDANGRVIWNGRDREGGVVRPGIYFVEAEAGGRRSVVRVALVR